MKMLATGKRIVYNHVIKRLISKKSSQDYFEMQRSRYLLAQYQV